MFPCWFKGYCTLIGLSPKNFDIESITLNMDVGESTFLIGQQCILSSLSLGQCGKNAYCTNLQVLRPIRMCLLLHPCLWLWIPILKVLGYSMGIGTGGNGGKCPPKCTQSIQLCHYLHAFNFISQCVCSTSMKTFLLQCIGQGTETYKFYMLHL